jgi:hypothetical protein
MLTRLTLFSLVLLTCVGVEEREYGSMLDAHSFNPI